MTTPIIDNNKSSRPVIPLMNVVYTPATGAVFIANDGVETFVMTPAATIATMSFKFPPKPFEGQLCPIKTTQQITALTLVANTGQTVSGAPAAFTLSKDATTIWRAVFNGTANATWYRMDTAVRSTAPRIPITVGASPYVYQNTSGIPQSVTVGGGTASLIELSRDNVTFDPCGGASAVVPLNPGDYVRVTYSVLPTMTAYPV